MRFLHQAKIRPRTRVLTRVDFNVDFDKRGRIVDAYRIENTLPTILWLRRHKAKTILLTHLGDPRKALAERAVNSTKPLVRYLTRILKTSVMFAPRSVGGAAELAVEKLKPGGVLLLENVRFEPGEVVNDPSFAAKLARLADIFVFDAFGVAHRAHASISLLPRLLPSYAGFLLEWELKTLSRLVKEPRHPLILLFGGAKIPTKLPILEHFSKSADYILVGGAVANTLLKMRGFSIGSSVAENLSRRSKKAILNSPKVILPVDVVTSTNTNSKKTRIHKVTSVPNHEMIFDIGPETVELFRSYFRRAKMIFWNGPMGYIENPIFAKGTEDLAKVIAKSRAFSVVGGGDTLVVLDKMKLSKKFDFVSTGGGAMLAFLAGERLPALEALGYYK